MQKGNRASIKPSSCFRFPSAVSAVHGQLLQRSYCSARVFHAVIPNAKKTLAKLDPNIFPIAAAG